MSDKKTRGRPKQDARVALERSEEILEAASRMFAARGYQNTDIEELAGELGIGKGTVYRAFPSKQELFFAALNRAVKRMSEYIRSEAEAEEHGVVKIQTSVRAFLRFFDCNPDVIELFAQERAEFRDRPHSTFFEHRRTNAARWEAFMSELMDEGYVRKMPADWLVDTLNQLLYGQIFLHRYYGLSETLESHCDDILTIFFTGILTPKGLQSARLGGRTGGTDHDQINTD